MEKSFFILFLMIVISILIFSASVVQSISFGISPEKILFSGKIGERICREFSLIGENFIFSGEIKWALKDSRNIEEYKLNSENLKLEAEFPKSVSAGNYEVCIKGKESGKYYGALFYRIEGTSYGIGTWVNLDISENEKNSKTPVLTGMFIRDSEKENSLLKNALYIMNVITFLSLVFLLLVLLRKNKDYDRQWNNK